MSHRPLTGSKPPPHGALKAYTQTALHELSEGPKMEGITPTFLLQVIIAVGSGGLAYGVLKTDLKNMMRSLDEERRIREEHSREDDQTHHDIRDEIQTLSNKVARIEGANDLTERLASLLKG